MKAAARAFVGYIACMLALLSAQQSSMASSAGRIDSISPAEARPDEIVTITGNGFGGQNVRIAVGGVPATVVSATGSSARFKVPRAVPIGPTTVTATNPGGQGGSIAFRMLLGFTVDAAASVGAAIGPAGGTLVTRSGGLDYTLAIPPGALEAVTGIVLTPVTAIDNLPFERGIVAAAQFGPSGLHLRFPATLTITRSAGLYPADFLAFLVDDQGKAFEIHGAGNSGHSLTVPVAHFTVGGAGMPSLADFERQIRPLIASLPPTLPPGQVLVLVDMLHAWLGQYGFDVCTQTTLCHDVFDIGVQSLSAARTATCTQVGALVAQGEPFLALEAVRPLYRIAAALVGVATDAMQADVTGFDATFDVSCLVTSLRAIVDLAKQQSIANPTPGLLTLFFEVADAAHAMDIDGLASYAQTALIDVIGRTVDRARQTCLVDPAAGEALLDVILQAIPLIGLDALSPGLAEIVNDARAGCRIHIAPPNPVVRTAQQLSLVATTDGLSPAGVTWSLQTPTLGSTIDPATGRFTAGAVAGNVTVRATSLANANLFNRVVVQVLPEVVLAVTPANATVRTGGTVTFTAQITGGSQGATWSATAGSIGAGPSSTAVYTAPATAGTYTVTARSVDDPTKMQAVQVTVVAPGTLAGTLAVHEVRIDDAIVAGGITFGGTTTLEASVDVRLEVRLDGSVRVLSVNGAVNVTSAAGAPCFNPDLPPIFEILPSGEVFRYGFNASGTDVTVETVTLTTGAYDPATSTLTFGGVGQQTSTTTNDDCTSNTSTFSYTLNGTFPLVGTPTLVGGRIVAIDFAQSTDGVHPTQHRTVTGVLR
ncbi:MAG: IPT/TIG domain-containing protein [Burkholderiales bacterium]